MTTAALCRAHRLRIPAWWLAGSLGAALTVLLAIQGDTLAGDVFAPLTVRSAQLTASMLAAIGLPVMREAATLIHVGGFACEIDVTCTALVPVVLLTTAIVLLRATPRAHFLGILIGMLLMVFVNQLRLVSLVWLGVHVPGYFDVAHSLLGPVLIILTGAGYGFIWSRATRR